MSPFKKARIAMFFTSVAIVMTASALIPEWWGTAVIAVLATLHGMACVAFGFYPSDP